MTKEQIKENIADLPNKSDDDLVYLFKCAKSKDKAAEKTLLKPYMLAIERERRKRGSITTISAKVSLNKAKEKDGANPDDY